MIVLDTDHLSCLEWGSAESATLREKLANASDKHVVVSTFCLKQTRRDVSRGV